MKRAEEKIEKNSTNQVKMLDIATKPSYNRYIDNTDNSYRNKGDVNPFSFVVDEIASTPNEYPPFVGMRLRETFWQDSCRVVSFIYY